MYAASDRQARKWNDNSYNLVYESIIEVVLLPEKVSCEAIISLVLAYKKAEKRGMFNVV